MAKRVDRRSAAYRSWHAIRQELLNDLGGEYQLTTADIALVEHAATLILKMKQLSAAVIEGNGASDDALTRVSNCAMRVLNSLRGNKRPKPKSELKDYLAARTAKIDFNEQEDEDSNADQHN
jgi:hypothetical protein